MKEFFLKQIILATLLFSIPAFAAVNFDSLYIGGTFGQTAPFSGNRFKDAASGDQSWGLYLGHKYNDKWAAELGYDKNSFDDLDLDSEFIHVGGAYRFRSQESVTPVLRAALGFNENKLDGGNDESGLGLKLGGGLEFHFPIFTFTALADWRYLDKVSSSLKESQALVATIGLIWPPIQVSANAAKGSASNQAKPKSENDQDHDGVLDSKDKCPSTAMGVVVNSLGCSKTETAVFKIKVEFEAGKTNLQDKYLSEIEELAGLMKSNPEALVEIAGHTDNTGSEKLNTTLSGQRAKSVADALVQKHGIDSTRIKSTGYGPTKPIADNSTLDGRKQNRRVEALISFQKEMKK